MNALINNELSYCRLEEDNDEQITVKDKFAVYFVGFLTVSALLLGSWSGIILLTGKTNNGGPLSCFVNVLQALGIL